ncbi:hypothetical protein CALCODRAFT_495423 [Calocera cornea HHB12733]|uniref:Uncharacterized protein n=1 Tax=Calocera cornea HHB12733 TaxID=1353952 RepID=A0A165GJ63_9BASI|nr:hypothetical protein CALCODRAFT_495423 [Calocera cornea HHB12733]
MLAASSRRSSTFSLPHPPPPQAFNPGPPPSGPKLTRRLSKRKWVHRDAQSLPPTSAPQSDYEHEHDRGWSGGRDLEGELEDLPRLVREHARVGELEKGTRWLERESLELKRTLSEWGESAGEELVPSTSNEQGGSTRVRALLRPKPARQQLAEQSHARAHGLHRCAVASGERALQDAFLAGRMTIDQYDASVQYLHENDRLPPSPKNPRKPPPGEAPHTLSLPAATSFRVSRPPSSRVASRAPSPSSSSLSLSSVDLPASLAHSPLTASHFPPRPPATRAQGSNRTIGPHTCTYAREGERGRSMVGAGSARGRGRFYVANPSPSPSPTSSEEDLPGVRR